MHNADREGIGAPEHLNERKHHGLKRTIPIVIRCSVEEIAEQHVTRVRKEPLEIVSEIGNSERVTIDKRKEREKSGKEKYILLGSRHADDDTLRADGRFRLVTNHTRLSLGVGGV